MPEPRFAEAQEAGALVYRNGLKRAVDVLGALLALILLAPVMTVIAIAIRLSDPGPAIFRQQRIGVGGRHFTIFKFRSMPIGTANVASDKLGEVRLTGIGRLIRRTNLDELPQLFNILKGDMSIVGPRPPVPSQTELIALRRENGSIDCRPGLTGLTQVNGYDGMSVPHKASFDGAYARRVTFLGDVAIILRTFGYLLKPPPTY